MPLLWKQLSWEHVKRHELFGEVFGLDEALRHKHVLADKDKIGHDHGAWSKQGLQVIRKLSTASISRVHSNEKSSCVLKSDFSFFHKDELSLLLFLCVQAGLHLSWDHRQHLYGNTVEFVEASPSAWLAKTHENLSHGIFVHLIGTVEHHDRQANSSSEIFCGLCLSSTSRAGRCTTHNQVQGLSKRDIASISKRSDHQTECVSYVLVRVESEPIDNFDNAFEFCIVGLPREPAKLPSWDIIVFINWPLKFELWLPGERFSLADSHVDEILDHVTRVHIDSNDVDNFHTLEYLKRTGDFVDKFIDTCFDQFVAFFHCWLSSWRKLLKGSVDVFCPHDLSSKQGHLCTVIFNPFLTRLIFFFIVPNIRSTLCVA